MQTQQKDFENHKATKNKHATTPTFSLKRTNLKCAHKVLKSAQHTEHIFSDNLRLLLKEGFFTRQKKIKLKKIIELMVLFSIKMVKNRTL